MAEISVTAPRFHRLAETDRAVVRIEVDGGPVDALEGDSVLVAVLTAGGVLRESEFGDGARAGFCLMGACQDCWMWTDAGGRLRACTTAVSAGLAVRTRPPEGDAWPIPA